MVAEKKEASRSSLFRSGSPLILTFSPGVALPPPPPPVFPAPRPVLASPAGPFPPIPPPCASPLGTPPGEPSVPPAGEMEKAPCRLPGGIAMEPVEGAGSTLRLSSPALPEGVLRVSSSSRVLGSLAPEDWVGGAGGGGAGTGIAGFGRGLVGATSASVGADGGVGAGTGTTTGGRIGFGTGAGGGGGRRAGGGGTSVPMRMLGSRISKGIFSSGGEEGCRIV